MIVRSIGRHDLSSYGQTPEEIHVTPPTPDPTDAPAIKDLFESDTHKHFMLSVKNRLEEQIASGNLLTSLELRLRAAKGQ